MANPVRQTPLCSLHQELGARMVEFAGYRMPVQYPGGIRQEHAHTRSAAGLFDISHMGQIRISGSRAAELMETLVPGDITGLPPGQQLYTVLSNKNGGVVDDLMVSNLGGDLLLVVNAARCATDLALLESALGRDCRVRYCGDRSLLALQGPWAAAVMARYVPQINELAFMRAGNYAIDEIDCLIHRSGYTGEDGFEISVSNARVEQLARLLLQNPEVAPVGLGARDSLRLEAGLCLYGHELDESTGPVEAGLGWIVAAKYRREPPAAAKFPGAEKILAQLREGTALIRTGIKPAGRIPVREDTSLLNRTGATVGRVTSGGYGATVAGPIAMAYLETEYAAPGMELHVKIRGRKHTVYTAALPFVAHRYHKS